MIILERINRIFRIGNQDVHALNELSLTISRGEYVSIMGPSGSGKSTLLNIIGLLDRPTSGAYILDGKDVTTLTEDEQAQVRQKKIGFVFQFFHLVPRLTALQNVELPMVFAGMPKAERKKRGEKAIRAVGIAERMNHRPDELSGGERQRVAIARATIMEPSVILADEPTGNLDRHSGVDVIELLEGLNRNDGITLVVVTHDLEVGQRARRQIRLVDGKVAMDVQT